MLELLQDKKNQHLQIITAVCSNNCKFPQSFTGAALQAIARVAASEGSHSISRSIVDPLNASMMIKAPPQPSEGTSEVAAGTLISDCLLPAIQCEATPLEGGGRKSCRSAVISGGLSGLGLLSGIWMTEQGYTSLMLLGRSGRGELSHSCICNATAEVTMARCDIAAVSEVAALGFGHLAGDIFHAGGILRDALIGRQSLDCVRQVFAPKVTGLENLDSAFSLCGAQVNIFSSIAGIVGSAGQASYAAANSYMDAWAEAHNHQVYLHHICIAVNIHISLCLCHVTFVTVIFLSGLTAPLVDSKICPLVMWA